MISTIEALTQDVESLGQPERRVLVGIVGGPGSGKSTLADKLVNSLNRGSEKAICVPMDGFHRRNSELRTLGLEREKGKPATFDAHGLFALLQQVVATDDLVLAPVYSREIEEVVPDQLEILQSHQIVVVEGNYLLLVDPAWQPIAQLQDRSYFLDAKREVATDRLLSRHRAVPKSPKTAAEIEDHVRRVDLINFDLVQSCQNLADRVVAQISD